MTTEYLPAGVIDARSADTQARRGKIVLVDIRTPVEWLQTGVPASAHAITMNQSAAVFLSALDEVLGDDRSRPFALICRSGSRSATLASQLRSLGYPNVLDVGEGMIGSRHGAGWLLLGLPLRTGDAVTARPAIEDAAA